MNDKSVKFQKITINKDAYGETIFDIYFVYENSRSKVIEKFNEMDSDTQDEIKDLISKMATVDNFKSPKIKYNLSNYNYGEIRPMPHRFFFFQKCGNNYIFFEYELKKVDSLPDDVYKRIERKKNKYAKEFEKFISGIQ